CPLEVDPGGRLGGARSLYERPLRHTFWGSLDQGTADLLVTRQAAHDHDDADAEDAGERVDVDDVESAEGDALEEDGLHRAAELARGDRARQRRRRIAAVALDMTRQDAFEPEVREGRADDQDRAPVAARERRVVEGDGMRQRARIHRAILTQLGSPEAVSET